MTENIQPWLNIFIQITNNIGAAGSVAGHIFKETSGTLDGVVTGCEHLAEIGDRGSCVTEV